MSKELIERLREAALLLTDKAAMDLNAAASVIEIMVADRDALAAELKAVRGDQAPTVEDINLQEWKGMDGGCAWHLIDRYAEDWHHTERLMNAWLEANREELIAELKALREQEPSCWTTYPPSGRYSKCKAEVDLWERNNWTIVPLYAHPVPARELTDADIALCIASADKSFAQERISGKPVLGVWSKHLARAIERHLKGEGE